MCNTHDTCKKHLAYRLCLYVGPSIAIAMGLAKIIRTHTKDYHKITELDKRFTLPYIVTRARFDCGF